MTAREHGMSIREKKFLLGQVKNLRQFKLYLKSKEDEQPSESGKRKIQTYIEYVDWQLRFHTDRFSNGAVSGNKFSD